MLGGDELRGRRPRSRNKKTNKTSISYAIKVAKIVYQRSDINRNRILKIKKGLQSPRNRCFPPPQIQPWGTRNDLHPRQRQVSPRHRASPRWIQRDSHSRTLQCQHPWHPRLPPLPITRTRFPFKHGKNNLKNKVVWNFKTHRHQKNTCRIQQSWNSRLPSWKKRKFSNSLAN